MAKGSNVSWNFIQDLIALDHQQHRLMGNQTITILLAAH
jgi:hypothetical protein